jgi:hypothetical protein
MSTTVIVSFWAGVGVLVGCEVGEGEAGAVGCNVGVELCEGEGEGLVSSGGWRTVKAIAAEISIMAINTMLTYLSLFLLEDIFSPQDITQRTWLSSFLQQL